MSHRASHVFFPQYLGQPLCSYPEFSVFLRNLVPSCALCNTRKRDRILEENTDIRVFLHPCYDSIPDAEFLIVRARNEGDAVHIVPYPAWRPGCNAETWPDSWVIHNYYRFCQLAGDKFLNRTW